MTVKCYDCVYCSVDKKYNQECKVFDKEYARKMGLKQPCNFFKTHSQDEAIKRKCAKRLVALGRYSSVDEYMYLNRRVQYANVKESE